MRQKRCNFMLTLLLFGDGVLDHRRDETHFADFGANQSGEPVEVFGGDEFHLAVHQFLS